MAFAAARAVIRARKEREKLLARTKALTEKTLDSNQRKELVVSLRLNEASSYLANLVEGYLATFISSPDLALSKLALSWRINQIKKK